MWRALRQEVPGNDFSASFLGFLDVLVSDIQKNKQLFTGTSPTGFWRSQFHWLQWLQLLIQNGFMGTLSNFSVFGDLGKFLMTVCSNVYGCLYRILMCKNVSFDSFMMFSALYSSQGSRDGYFEMSLDDSVEESVSTLAALPPEEESSVHQGELCEEELEEEEEEVKVIRVLWCYCLQVKEEVEQKEACLVLTERLFGLLSLTDDFTRTNQDKGEWAASHSLSENKAAC